MPYRSSISKHLLGWYLKPLINKIIRQYKTPVKDPSLYEQDNFTDIANRLNENKEHFKIALDYLLLNPLMDVKFLGSGEYEWQNNEIRDLLQELRNRIWLNETITPLEILTTIELTDQPFLEWKNEDPSVSKSEKTALQIDKQFSRKNNLFDVNARAMIDLLKGQELFMMRGDKKYKFLIIKIILNKKETSVLPSMHGAEIILEAEDPASPNFKSNEFLDHA